MGKCGPSREKLSFKSRKEEFNQKASKYALTKGVFSEFKCWALIKAARQYNTSKALVTHQFSDYGVSGHRDCDITWLPQDLRNHSLSYMWRTLFDLVKAVNESMWRFDLVSFAERAQFTRYDLSGHFSYHMDLGDDVLSERKVSVVVLLSDPADFEGGELQLFPDTTIPMEQGDVVMFPSYMVHRLTPVTKGQRFSLVVWCGGSTFS